MRITSLALAAMLVLVSIVRAQESPSDWIRKLGSGSYIERERAAKRLEDKGKAVLPLLRDAVANADLETRRRVVLLMERIEERTLVEDIINPTPTRLKFQEMDLNDALRAMEPRIGLRCNNVNFKQRIGSLDTGELPYWQAWARFCQEVKLAEGDYARSAAKLMPMREGLDDQMKYLLTRTDFTIKATFQSPRIDVSASTGKSPYAVDDRHSVRVRARWMMADHKIDKAVPHAVFAFEVRAEPRLEITGPPRIELTKIVDELGNEKSIQAARLLPDRIAPADAILYRAFVGEVQYGGLLHLHAIPWPAESGKLRALHGSVRLNATVRPSLIEVTRVLKSIGKKAHSFDGVSLKVLDCDRAEEGDIALRIHLDNLTSLTPQTPEQKFLRVRPGLLVERGAIDVAMERLELRDGRGQVYRRVKAHYQQAQDGKGYEVELHFAAKSGQEEPMLVLTKAPRTIVLNVPFVVRDLTWDGVRETASEHR